MQTTGKIYILALASFLVGTSQYVISGILDTVSKELNISLGATGQLITIFSLVYGICTPILMAMFAKVDRRKLMLSALGLFIIGNFLAFLLPGYRLFLVSRIIMALGAGMVVVNALTLAAKIADKDKQGSAIATVIMGLTASLIIGVPLGRIIASVYSWHFIFLGIAVLGLMIGVLLYFMIPQNVKGDRPLPLLQQLALLKKPKVSFGLSITFFLLAGYAVVYTYLSPYLLSVSGINNHLLSTVFLIFGLASLVGSKFGGYSADKWGIRFTLIGGLVLHLVMLIMLALVTHSFISVLILLIIWSFAAWLTGPTQQYHLATIDPESSGVLLGFNQSMMQLGLAAGAGVGGVVTQNLSLVALPWIGALGVLIAIGASAVVFNLADKKNDRNLVSSKREIN